MKKECLTIIGTAHVSQDSVDEVKQAIYEQEPDVVAIELDRGRYERLLEEKKGTKVDEKISVTKIIKEGKVGLFIISSILTYIQSKIGEDLDIKPGSEMIEAIEAANDLNIKIALIDRDINITLQRVLNKATFMEKLKFFYGAIVSLFTSDDEEIEDIEQLKESDTLDEIMEYFKDMSPNAYEVLVKERDAYLAKSILNIEDDHVIAVVGAGHKEGINYYLDNPQNIPPIESLVDIDKKGFPWLKIILATIPISFIVIFFLAFINGIDIQGNLIEFVLIGGGTAFIGSLLSGSKIQSAIVGFIVAPLTIIHPLLAAGWFSGLTEAKYRKVKQSDLANLAKAESLRDLWNNNIFRILLVALGTNLGVSVATLVILPSRVFIPLFFKVWGG
ncbi:MAG: TraB/GumN family protein [Methanobacteriaceae archaeon]|jgi:pheromone shutdown-related protein TraB|nr:TraB/GumN family protein [Candidatus Methanorudis spinitermitis]